MTKTLGGKTNIVVACCFLACLFTSLFLCSSNVSAYSASISTSGNIVTNVVPNGQNNVTTKIGVDEVNVITNCRAGYNLNISGPSDRNLYLNGNSSNNTSGQYFTPVDGVSTLANSTNAWGYSLTANTENGVFFPLPSSQIAIKTPAQTASQTNINDTIHVYYGVSTANTISPGSYSMPNNGSILYQLTIDESCISYTIQFNANGGTGFMDEQNLTTDQTARLSANSFNAPSKGSSYQDSEGNTITATPNKLWAFWGWNTEVDGSGDWYKDREEVTNLAEIGDTIIFYAQWKQATLADMTTSTPINTEKVINHNTMQDMSTEICWNSDKFTAIGTPYGQATLVDSRDGVNRTYTVAKLPDGYCWMTQNLNLGTSTAITLTSDDTDLEEGSTFVLPASSSSDFTTGTGSENINKAMVLNNMTIPNYTVNGTTYSGKINGYYSYAAATANTATYSSSSDDEIFTTSICPKNWDLPTSTQFYNLRTAGSVENYNNTNSSYDGKNAGKEPYNFIYGGYRKAAGATVNTTYFSSPTSYGYLWLANNYTSTNGRFISISTSGISNTTTGYSLTKYYGLSIRCVANMDNAIANITFVNTETGETQTQRIGVIGENNSIQIKLPSAWSKSGYGLSGWDTNSSGSNIVYTFDQVATFSEDTTLYTVWRPRYNVQYDGNGADAGVMTNIKHLNTYENDSFDLFASNYSKAGYGFVGWSFDPNAQPGGSSRIYGPNETAVAPAGTAGENKKIYAIWVQSSGNLQGWQGCSSMSVGDVIALKDIRDNNVYAVGKLADGNCWMMENLRLDAANSGDSSKAQGFGAAFVGLANPETSNFSNVTAANSLYNDTIITGEGSSDSRRFPRYNNSNTSSRTANPSAVDDRLTATSTHGNILEADIYSYGNYYTWAAAKANTGLMGSAGLSNSAHTSICPSGWKLPEGSSGNFGRLLNVLSGTPYSVQGEKAKKLLAYPNNFIYSHYYFGSSQTPGYTNYDGNNIGAYWQATEWAIGGDVRAYAFEVRFYNGDYSSFTTSYMDKYYGLPIRCVTEEGLEIKLMLNDGTGRVGGRVYGEAGATVSLPTSASTTRNGYILLGWNTSADGSGTTYNSYTFDPSATTGVVLYAKWGVTYTIQYDGNNADEGTMTNIKHTNTYEGDILDLFASNYSRAGYGFVGWSFDPNAQPGGSSRIYGPNEVLEAPAATISGETKTLYAIWVQSSGNLQGWQGCSNMSTGDITALKDTRDDNVYAVGKLADGNCWMIENLRLNTAGSSDSVKAQGFGGAFVGLADPEGSNFTDTTISNTLYSSNNITGSNIGYRIPRYNNYNSNSRETTFNNYDSDNRTNAASTHVSSLSRKIFSYGNYYTWSAALANTNDYAGPTSTINGYTSETVGTSICPSGWRLPYGRTSGNGISSGGFAYLLSRIGASASNEASSRKIRSYPNNFTYNGYYTSDSRSSTGFTGYYWSSTSYSNTHAYSLSFTYDIVSNSYDSKYNGFSVRCVFGS